MYQETQHPVYITWVRQAHRVSLIRLVIRCIESYISPNKTTLTTIIIITNFSVQHRTTAHNNRRHHWSAEKKGLVCHQTKRASFVNREKRPCVIRPKGHHCSAAENGLVAQPDWKDFIDQERKRALWLTRLKWPHWSAKEKRMCGSPEQMAIIVQHGKGLCGSPN